MKVNIEYGGEDQNFITKSEVVIDPEDVWGLDHTLATIIAPCLRKLKEDMHGSCNTDLEDGDNIEDIHKRWENVLDKMIWSFENILTPDEDKFYTYQEGVEPVEFSDPDERGVSEMIFNMEVDRDGLDEYNERIQNGLNLFGKYFRGLWN